MGYSISYKGFNLTRFNHQIKHYSAAASGRRFVGLAEEEGDLIKVRVKPVWRNASCLAEDGPVLCDSVAAGSGLHKPEAYPSLSRKKHLRTIEERLFCPDLHAERPSKMKDHGQSKHLMAAAAAHCLLFSGCVRLQLEKGRVTLS